MSLRDDLIEAMMQAEKDAGFVTDPTAARVALDAFLGTLADRADDWWDAWFDSSRDLYDSLHDDHIRQLIAVLRGDT